MSDFTLRFNTGAFEELDQFALLACQSYNLSNDSDWFGLFREGLYGFYARLHGVSTHYELVHSWIAKPRLPTETEYHLASIFFNMDSAIECLVFALNALGYAAAPQHFRDITDGRSLRQIKPEDILGSPHNKPPHVPQKGFCFIFPQLQEFWRQHIALLSTIFEQHDVSKHRQRVYTGGRMRDDPPDGFFKAMGAKEDITKQVLLSPHAEIILMHEPKSPRRERSPQSYEDRLLLETLAKEFQGFVNSTGILALEDSKVNIKLSHSKLLRTK